MHCFTHPTDSSFRPERRSYRRGVEKPCGSAYSPNLIPGPVLNHRFLHFGFASGRNDEFVEWERMQISSSLDLAHVTDLKSHGLSSDIGVALSIN